MSDPIKDLCELYDLTHEEALSILRQSIGDALGYTVASDVEVGNRIYFYANRADGSRKTIRLSPLLERRTRQHLERNIDLLRMKKLRHNGIEIINATIIERSKKGLVLSSKTGKAFAPSHLLIKEEEPFYKVGTTLDFHIKKITDNGLILDRRSKNLLIHTLKRLLPKGFVLYDINRCFGKRINVYSNVLPEKIDLERIRASFVENINFVLYDRANIQNIIQKGNL